MGERGGTNKKIELHLSDPWKSLLGRVNLGFSLWACERVSDQGRHTGRTGAWRHWCLQQHGSCCLLLQCFCLSFCRLPLFGLNKRGFWSRLHICLAQENCAALPLPLLVTAYYYYFCFFSCPFKVLKRPATLILLLWLCTKPSSSIFGDSQRRVSE